MVVWQAKGKKPDFTGSTEHTALLPPPEVHVGVILEGGLALKHRLSPDDLGFVAGLLTSFCSLRIAA